MAESAPIAAEPGNDAGAATPGRELTTRTRVRRAMYLAFFALAALACLQAWYAHRYEQIRAADADIINISGNQRTFTQQMGRLAALAGGDEWKLQTHADLLAEALDRSRSDALLVEAMLSEQAQLARRSTPGVSAALERWQAARERLWGRCEVLLRHLSDRRPAAIPQAADALQIEVDPALLAASELTDRLQEAARERSRGQLRLLEGGVAMTLTVLLLLSLFVVEPTARAVREQVERLAEQARELSLLATVAAHTHNRVVITDAQRRIEWVNDAFVRGTGYTLAEVRGRNPGDVLHTEVNDPKVLKQMRESFARGEAVRGELLSRGKNGVEHWLELDVQPLRDAGGLLRGFVSVGTDVTERRRLQEQLRHSSRTDTLTGLPNRAVVLDRVQRAIDHAERNPGYGFAVLFMDFDRFKQVNDTLGHGAGDELLRQIARRIEQTLRPGDAVARVTSELQTAARVGGDEFVVVLEGVRCGDDAWIVAERLLEVLAEPYTIRSHPVQSTASIGIVSSEHAARSADEVLRDADTAMYEAKRSGRGRCVAFDSSMHERIVRTLEIEADLRRALREGELFVVYQPVVELATGALTGAEALVRWRHPQHGIVPPGRFIGVAEECGLIDAIGQEVLQTACRQFALWRGELGALAPRQVAVNLSRVQLEVAGLVERVKTVLEAHAMEPRELQLEVTESHAAQDDRVQTTLRELKALGVGLALDDFGTGYSSLACLHQLPVDTVKIDRSFVMHAETVEYHRVLIEATIRVAQALGMTTIAEGIETSGQAALMEGLRCQRGQGYLFSHPLPAEDFARWVRTAAAVSA